MNDLPECETGAHPRERIGMSRPEYKPPMNPLELAVKELYHWQKNGSTDFSAKLFELMMKADPGNMMKLTSAFPMYARALEMWQEAAHNGDALFREYGLMGKPEVK